MKTVNYLDLTLNLENSAYHRYQKENNQIKYISIEPNHPPSIIKQLPLSIQSRLSSLFSSEEILNDSLISYQDALDKSGYKESLHRLDINEENNCFFTLKDHKENVQNK